MIKHKNKPSENHLLISNEKYFKNTFSLFMMFIFVLFNGIAGYSQGILEKRVDTIEINQYKNGKKEGLWRTYYEAGQLKTEGNYETGLKEGLHRTWEDNGILLLEGFYAKGKANGLMKWFHERGHLAGEGNMENGIRIGKWKICDVQENGFCIEANFKDGKRDGIWKIYHEDARDKLWKEQTWKDDKIVSEKCWDKDGLPIECK